MKQNFDSQKPQLRFQMKIENMMKLRGTREYREGAGEIRREEGGETERQVVNRYIRELVRK